MTVTQAEALQWLAEQDPQRLETLWQLADRVRRDTVGDAVHLRGLLEISNYCDRSCWYCGLRLPNHGIARYRLSAEEIMAAAFAAVERGYGTVVMQAGEDPGLDLDELCHVIGRLKQETALAVTLSLGERTVEELQRLRRAGADRYLLRFETSNEGLFQRIHPPQIGEPSDQRRERLQQLRDMGYELGSGVMVGLPGQTWDDLARDVLLFQQLDLDMIGIGPYIPHPDTPLAREVASARGPVAGNAARADATTTCKMVALARLACPAANIPSTTALATLDPEQGQLLGLQRGANVLMPNITPRRYRRDYAIYPQKAGLDRTPIESDAFARTQLARLGRPVAGGRGDSLNHLRRRAGEGTKSPTT